MRSKKVVITGAGGFIGLELCHYLTARGHTVVGVDLNFPTEPHNLQFDAQIADIRDNQTMKTLLKGQDIVFHLASAHLNVNMTEAEYWDVNVHSLPSLLETAHTSGVKQFIHVSSVGVYGNLSSWPADEQTMCSPQSIYGKTKLAGEQKVTAFTERTGFPTAILRPAWVYGPTCPRTRKLYRALRSRTFIMIGNGSNLRHPIYITDLLDAFFLIMEQGIAEGEIFILGGERFITTEELIQTMCRVFELKEPWLRIPYSVGKGLAGGIETCYRWLKKVPPVSRRTLEFFNTNNAFDISKAKNTLQFSPQYSFEAGLQYCRESLVA